jgi:hypothetical protein
MPSSTLDIMRRAMLPLDGSIAEHVPGIVRAYARVVPPREWHDVTLVDFTAGSCLMALLFAASGIDKLIVNDIAERSHLTAQALFGRRRLDAKRVRRLLSAPAPRLRPHTPSFHFAADYITAEIAGTFDRLYFARLPAVDRPIYRYLALRWATGFSPSSDAEGGINILPTHDYRQLLADPENDWRPYVQRMRQQRSVMATLIAEINAALPLLRGARVEIQRRDMLDLCRDAAYGARNLVVVNPPTNGIDEYVIDDQFLHSLLANRWLPLSRSRETAEEFWIRRVEAALRRVPRGSHVVVWGGDGALTWPECWRVWTRWAVPLQVHRIRQDNRRPGWAILEKR